MAKTILDILRDMRSIQHQHLVELDQEIARREALAARGQDADVLVLPEDDSKIGTAI